MTLSYREQTHDLNNKIIFLIKYTSSELRVLREQTSVHNHKRNSCRFL